MTLLEQTGPIAVERLAGSPSSAEIDNDIDTNIDAAEGAVAALIGIGVDTDAEVPAFGPVLCWSIAIASMLMLLGTGIPMMALTGSAWDGIGLGAFCAFWGGPGFATMAAGAVWTLRCERAERRPGPKRRLTDR